ncbi:hypothetical protein N825_18550 [Skermanella stibiiresistens SB22]|uniref:Uncharacterized protein n=1 Tax=Skermanella stibiiresistens SB22 TaxID=1385369 RepID=W9HEI0_9PROT|nr:hypothetical protein N825_18550 [Skermanella stibiiresistens SB22]
MGTAVRTAKTSTSSRDAFADVDAFVDEVLSGLVAMESDGTFPARIAFIIRRIFILQLRRFSFI